MTRTEAIAIITTTLQAVDDQTLTAAAAHLAQLGAPSDITVGDIVGAAQTDSVLPRQLSNFCH